MAKKNSEFVGKVWKIQSSDFRVPTYIFCEKVQAPKSRYNDYLNRTEDEDGTVTFASHAKSESKFYTTGYSKMIGKNENNQYTYIELTPDVRKNAVETSWDEYILGGIN